MVHSTLAENVYVASHVAEQELFVFFRISFLFSIWSLLRYLIQQIKNGSAKEIIVKHKFTIVVASENINQGVSDNV